jgi:hypothetical protein
MSDSNQVQKPSSIYPKGDFVNIQKDYTMFSTPALLIFLFVIFFILKSYIYITDPKRKGQ